MLNRSGIIFQLVLSLGIALVTGAAELNTAALISIEELNDAQAKFQLFLQVGRAADALPITKQWALATETRYGESTNTATALMWLANNYATVGDWNGAKPIFERALKMYEKIVGSEAVLTAMAMNRLASLEQDMGDYAEALAHYTRSLEILEKGFGANHSRTLNTLNNLASLYYAQSDYALAAPLFERCLKIREETLGPSHVDTAYTLNNLAMLYSKTGDYRKAIHFCERSLKAFTESLGADHPNVAVALENLAVVYQTMGEYARASSLFERALAIKEKAFGPDHPSTSIALNNLASLYYEMGDYAKALLWFESGLKIRETKLGAEHLETAISLGNLAQVYEDMNDYAKAEALQLRALKIRETRLGTNNPQVATTLNGLAGTYQSMGDYQKALPLYQRSLEIMERVYGTNHLDTAKVLNNLALLLIAMREPTKAKPLLARSLAIQEHVLGSDHRNTFAALQNISWLLWMMDSTVTPEILSLARRTGDAEARNLGQILSFTTETQRLAYQNMHDPYSLFANLGQAKELAGILLHNKGIVLESLLEDWIVAQSSQNPEIQAKIQQIREQGRQLIRQQTVTQDKNEAEHQQRLVNLEKMEAELESQQKALAQNVARSGQTRRSLKLTLADVQAQLPKNAVLIEFVRYQQYLGTNHFVWHYGAVLIGSHLNATNEPIWVALGRADLIETNLRAYAVQMRARGQGEPILLRSLHDQLWQPIQKNLPKTIRTVILSPDAELNFLSFATLVNPLGQFLGEQYAIQYVASGRDLVVGSRAKPGRDMVIFANPLFKAMPKANLALVNQVRLGMSDLNRGDYTNLNLLPLPGTEREADFLKTNAARWHLEPRILLGQEAQEVEIHHLQAPYVLHLATHGFYLPSIMSTNNLPETLGVRRPVSLKNPMQRSGLALAGAQVTLDAWKRGETPDSLNDGILTAQEVGLLDLQGTWLVVLSACDTGTGKAQAGEGVMGLRRGFMLAGAQNLLMTLWPISDKYTALVMNDFYEEAMQTKQAPESLAKVQRKWLVQLREQYGALMAARLAGPFVMTYQTSVPPQP